MGPTEREEVPPGEHRREGSAEAFVIAGQELGADSESRAIISASASANVECAYLLKVSAAIFRGEGERVLPFGCDIECPTEHHKNPLPAFLVSSRLFGFEPCVLWLPRGTGTQTSLLFHYY